MGIGFFRKLKDFGTKIWKGAKNIVKKVLPVAAPIIKDVVPKIIPQAAPFIDSVLNVASNITGANLGDEAPDEEEDYDDENEYMKLKNGI